MTTEQWGEVKRLFGAVLELPAGQRPAWLAEHCADPELRTEVESLLRTYDDSTQFLEERPAGHVRAIEQALAIPQPGQWVGAYQLEREIGRGGMGIVYAAKQQGDGFEQRVALKLIRAGYGLEELAERFKYERRILARLEHPGIARLHDGGSTASGMPYLVMEFIDGLPIDQYCAERALSPAGRVRLMVEVCEAVSYAHQNLVIHRDLKPSNILVNAEGRPKLLDFGIAKVVSEDAGLEGLEQTRTGRYLLTPEYASPEQLRGAALTTSVDIYALGVLLYSLLSKHRPFDLTGLPPMEAMRRVVETEPEAPSRRADDPGSREALRGDLDNIILKCLRKDPRERYSSARALGADLAAWLEGRPVAATAPTLGYRLSKWVRRNKMEAAVVGALVLSVAGGTLGTLWQARQAQTARLKAETRFREVQKVSRSLIFEIHESVRKLPGATETRELILRRATEFFDGLARDAGDDSALKVELAEGYRKLGSVLGSDISENLGRKTEALAVYKKGVKLAEEAVAAQPGQFEPLAVLDSLLVELGLLYGDLDRKTERQQVVARLEEVIGVIGRDHSKSARARSALAIDSSQLAMLVTADRQYDKARVLYARAIREFDSLPPDLAGSRRVRAQRAFTHKRIGGLLIVAGKLEEAEKNYLRALEIDRTLMQESPGERRLRYDASFAYSDLGLIARRRGNHNQSVDYYKQVVAIREAAHQEDPKDQRVLKGAGAANCNLGESLRFARRYQEARPYLARCIHLRLELAGRNEDRNDCYLPGVAYYFFAQLLADEAEASPAARKSGLLQESRAMLGKTVESAAGCTGDRKEYDEAAAELRARLNQLSSR